MALTLEPRYLPDGTLIVTDADDDATRYVVWQDDAPESPNDWGDAQAYIYRSSSHGSADEPGDVLSDAFFRVYRETGDDEHALAVARRYARVILGWSAQRAADSIVTYSARGYSQSDWWDILAIDPHGYAEVHAQTWEQWARGDVYVVMRETRIECDSEDCHGDDEAHWEPGDALGGIYADDAESAVSHALGNGLA